MTLTLTHGHRGVHLHGNRAAPRWQLEPEEDFTVTPHYVPTDMPQISFTAPGSGAGNEYVLLTAGIHLIMIDRAGAPIYVQLVPNAAHDVLPAEGHDFMLLGDEHYVSMSYVQRVLDMSKVNPSCPACGRDVWIAGRSSTTGAACARPWRGRVSPRISRYDATRSPE
jgi:hypothetical protein